MSEEKIDLVHDMLKTHVEQQNKQMEHLFEAVRPIPVMSETLKHIDKRVTDCEETAKDQGTKVESIKEKQDAQENQAKGLKAGLAASLLAGGGLSLNKIFELFGGGAP